MQPQGTGPVNADYFVHLTARINGIQVCAELQAVVDEAMATLQAEKTAIENQIAALLPVLALLTLPTDLGSVISWISNLATHLIGPVVIPYTGYLTQAEQMLTEIAALTTAIENAASRIGSCSVTMRTLT